MSFFNIGQKKACCISYFPLSCSLHPSAEIDAVDLIVRSIVVEEDDDDLNEGFCHYSIVDDE